MEPNIGPCREQHEALTGHLHPVSWACTVRWATGGSGRSPPLISARPRFAGGRLRCHGQQPTPQRHPVSDGRWGGALCPQVCALCPMPTSHAARKCAVKLPPHPLPSPLLSLLPSSSLCALPLPLSSCPLSSPNPGSPPTALELFFLCCHQGYASMEKTGLRSGSSMRR